MNMQQVAKMLKCIGCSRRGKQWQSCQGSCNVHVGYWSSTGVGLVSNVWDWTG